MKESKEIRSIEDIVEIIEDLDPSDLLTAYMSDRPYNGQPHTNTGERGKQEVSGVTFRDIRDCFVIACFKASGLDIEDYPESLYKLPWDEMDPLAVFQNMSCEIEKRMGIYPNIPTLNCSSDFEDKINA